jgi:glucan biosynthesis protein C
MALSLRLPFIDNLRWVMIMLVVSMHAAVTYSHLGSWYFMEDTPVSKPEAFVFGTYQAWLQSFFMGFLFFIAGYFVPKAYDTKGPGRFLRDRALRLGVPLLLYVFLLQPVAVYCIYLFDSPGDRIDLLTLYSHYIARGRWISGTGPLWFCEALLIFCAVYALLRVAIPAIRARVFPAPGKKAIAGFIALIAVSSFGIRLVWPNGTDLYNLQLCYFSQYVFFFIAGIFAYRGNWLQKWSAATGRYWGRAALIGGMVLWIGLLVFGGALKGDLTAYKGGFHWQSFGECCREQLAGVGLSLFFLLWFRERFNSQGRLARFFSANAFAVYVFHAPILIALSKMMVWLHLPLLLKFLLLTLLSIGVTYLLSALIFRRLPLLKNIL